ncbi:hypothetical protein CDAR_547401 [Caerostris darwini]|uniref:Secreted protein n=1 Tax=Caerostris darwini TaxID=1538125 RepID=A0AAV4V8D4_9ARAC|nr:hypothetical protein CDAR_547401 [Caerostris darwini]
MPDWSVLLCFCRRGGGGGAMVNLKTEWWQRTHSNSHPAVSIMLSGMAMPVGRSRGGKGGVAGINNSGIYFNLEIVWVLRGFGTVWRKVSFPV